MFLDQGSLFRIRLNVKLISFVRAFFNGLGEEHITAAFLNGANKGTSQGLKLNEASYAHGFLLWE